MGYYNHAFLKKIFNIFHNFLKYTDSATLSLSFYDCFNPEPIFSDDYKDAWVPPKEASFLFLIKFKIKDKSVSKVYYYTINFCSANYIYDY